VLVMLVGSYCVYSGVHDRSVRAHAYSFIAFTSWSSANLQHAALMVFCLNALTLWFLCLLLLRLCISLVAVCSMILCSCRLQQVVFVTFIVLSLLLCPNVHCDQWCFWKWLGQTPRLV
jgi:hypothetical protein